MLKSMFGWYPHRGAMLRIVVITGPGPIPIQDGENKAADQGGAEQPRRERRRVFEAFKLCRQTAAVPY